MAPELRCACPPDDDWRPGTVGTGHKAICPLAIRVDLALPTEERTLDEPFAFTGLRMWDGTAFLPRPLTGAD